MAGIKLKKPKAAKGAAAIGRYADQASKQGGFIGGFGMTKPKKSGGPVRKAAPKRK